MTPVRLQRLPHSVTVLRLQPRRRLGPGLTVLERAAGPAVSFVPFVPFVSLVSSVSRPPQKPKFMMDYNRWTKEALIRRIQELEQERRGPRAEEQKEKGPEQAQGKAQDHDQASRAADASLLPPAKKPRTKKAVDPSKYTTRFIALKLAYLGKRYGGFEYQPSGALPSVEEELWKALVKACLVFPAAPATGEGEGETPGKQAFVAGNPDIVDFAVCDYNKCGRTDRGVSSFGQVISLRVRSNKRRREEGDGGRREGDADLPPEQELQYCKILNRLLPPDIRVLAWCPAPPPGFSARFSCRERQYRYFFTLPAYFAADDGLPSGSGFGSGAGSVRSGRAWLDIEAMRTAARHFVGLHDFRNFCKVDAGKQITNFERRIFAADIVEVPGLSSSLTAFSSDNSDGHPRVYAFDVRGSAFLWHQIRHMVAVLFLVGQGRESPDVVPQLLDVAAQPCRPAYTMADEAPLVLWDCIYPPQIDPDTGRPTVDADVADPDTPDSLTWIYACADAAQSRLLVEGLWQGWREAKMDEILANRLLDLVTRGGNADETPRALHPSAGIAGAAPPVPPPLRLAPPNANSVFEGGNGARTGGVYLPLLKRPRLAAPDAINDRYAQQYGFASSEAMRQTVNWRAVVKASKAGGTAE